MKEKNLLFYLLMISSCARNWGVSIVNNENFSRYGLGVSNQFLVQLDEKRLVWPPFFLKPHIEIETYGKEKWFVYIFPL